MVRRFVEAINAHDVPAIVSLMTEDHAFVDATGARHAGRDAMEKGWIEYFTSFPDYRIQIEETMELRDRVALFGWANSSSWHIPAVWRAIVQGGRIREWRVWCDVEPMLRGLGISR